MDEYDIAKLYQEMELELVASLKRNLLRHELKEIEENMEYPQWQALKLRDIQRIKRENQDIIGKYISNIPKHVKKIIKEEYKQGKKEAISLFNDANRGKRRLNESFFKTNNKKVKAMIDEINGTFKEAEKAIFRMSNDVYQKTIFKAGFYLSHGAVNLKQAINIAMKDFAKRGINCIEYKDGRRINIADYARMAVRTASQRARLMAEGDFRKRLKRTLVKITKHGTSCKYCKVYEQQILVDDVYSGGVPDGKHELLSNAMSKGLFHPNCRHKAPTYYEELDVLKYEQMAKSATAKEEEERKKDLFSQNEQRKRRVEILENDKIFNSKGRIIVKDSNILKNDIIDYFDIYNKDINLLDKVFKEENYYIGNLPDIEEFKNNKYKEVIINKRGIITIIKKHNEMNKNEMLQMFNVLKDNKTNVYKENNIIHFFMNSYKNKTLDLGVNVKQDENYVFHYTLINSKYTERKIKRLKKIK
nr:MAG TPA: minor capsid protein [Caudoviricetes sp.]